jgi:hypothetical protein
VYEYVLAVCIVGDEAIAFAGIKPLNYTCVHFQVPPE